MQNLISFDQGGPGANVAGMRERFQHYVLKKTFSNISVAKKITKGKIQGHE